MNCESSLSDLAAPWARRRLWLLSLLLLNLTAVVFAHVCGQAFVDWDDPIHTYENPSLSPLSAHHLAWFWRQSYQGEYIPVSYMVYSFLACVGRLHASVPTPSGGMTTLNPHVFHTANLVLHLLNVLLVFWLLRRIVKRDLPAFAGALFFALHPVQVEAVAWISELRGLLSSFLGLLALCGYFDYACLKQADAPVARLRRSYMLAFTAFLLALLAKPSAVVIPVLAGLLDIGILRRDFKTSLKALAGWLLPALPIFWLTRDAQVVAPALNLPLWQRPLVAVDALAFYQSKLLLPLHLGIDYGRTPAFVLSGPSALYTWIAPVLLLALIWRFRRSLPFLPIAFGLFVAALLPVLGFAPFLFQNFSTVADRYLYLALLGPALALAWTLAKTKGRAYPLAVGSFLLLCACLSHAQVTVWNNSQTLFEHALAVNPQSAAIHYDLGNTDRYRGKTQDAIAQYQMAIEIKPDFAQAHCNLGQALADAGDIPDGIAQMRESIRLKPNLPQVHLSLGLLLAEGGDTVGAIREWQAALQITPNDVDARYNLGCALCRRHQLSEAQTQFETILRLDPRFTRAQQALKLIAQAKAS